MTKLNITTRLCEEAIRLGFDLVGITRSKKPQTFDHFIRWIACGHHAQMDYLAKNVALRSDPNHLLPGACSLILLGVSYQTVLSSEPELQRLFFAPASDSAKKSVKVASYACGLDYHLWTRQRLKSLAEFYRKLLPQSRCRGVVDTAPLLERQFAANAGLGQIGKNTMLIHPQWGSKIFLAALLTTEKLEYSESFPSDICGACRKCMDACPTGAIEQPYLLNARKCLNYWTIEHRGEIPKTIRKQLQGHFFGCEICQNVCPWNQAVERREGHLFVEELENRDAEEWKARLARTPLAWVALMGSYYSIEP